MKFLPEKFRAPCLSKAGRYGRMGPADLFCGLLDSPLRLSRHAPAPPPPRAAGREPRPGADGGPRGPATSVRGHSDTD